MPMEVFVVVIEIVVIEVEIVVVEVVELVYHWTFGVVTFATVTG